MKRICGILTLAAGMALTGCAGDNVAWHNDNSMSTPQPAGIARNDKTSLLYDQNRPAYSYSTNTDADNSATDMHKMDNNGNYVRSTADNNNAGPQLAAGNDKTPAAGVSNLDNRFINDAIAGGMFEVSAGERALMKSSDTSVKSLAQHIVDDHNKANTQLKALATRKGVRVVNGMSTEQDNMLAQLDKLSGSDFDKEYLRQQQVAHQDTIQKFQDAANNANDKDLRDWAAATLPTLREHLQMVQNQTTGINTNTGIGSDK